MSKEDVQKYVPSSSETENDGLICEFKDDMIYKNNPLWTSSNKSIQIMLYCDEFVVVTHWEAKLKNEKNFCSLLCIRKITKEKTFYLEFN